MAFERTRLGGMGRAAVPLGALGATVGPVLDGFHTWSGTTWYTSPGWLRTVWWCPLLFGGAALAIGLSRPLLEGRAAPVERAAAGRLAAAIGLFVVAYAASAFLPASSLV